MDVRWVKAEEMREENLGMGRNEVTEVIRVSSKVEVSQNRSRGLTTTDDPGSFLVPALRGRYRRHIAHSTLVVGCLRKLQGWHMDSIIAEIARFEPDHEDLPHLALPHIIPVVRSVQRTPRSPLPTISLDGFGLVHRTSAGAPLKQNRDAENENANENEQYRLLRRSHRYSRSLTP